MKKLFIGLLALGSFSAFAMSYGEFAVHCEAQRDIVREIDKTLESKSISNTTKEAYFNHIMRKIELSKNCGDLNSSLRNILKTVEAK